MDIVAYLLLSAVPLVVGYLIIRLAVRHGVTVSRCHGVTDAHSRMQQPEVGRPGRCLP